MSCLSCYYVAAKVFFYVVTKKIYAVLSCCYVVASVLTICYVVAKVFGVVCNTLWGYYGVQDVFKLLLWGNNIAVHTFDSNPSV